MFSWSHSGSRRPSSTTYPAHRASQTSTPPVAQAISGSIRPPTRQQHLDSYLQDATLKPSTRRVSSDDTTYDTVFQTTTGIALILRVRLPPIPHSTAPSRTPAMTLVGVRATHPWLDSRMCIVGYEVTSSQERWQSSGVLLGTAVNAVVRQLQLEPPDIIEITDPGLQRIQQHVSGNSSSATTSASRPTPPRQKRNGGIHHPDAPPDYESLNIPEIQLPEIPTEFPELNDMTREELQTVLDDELDFLTLVHKLPVYRDVQQKAASAMEENVELAQSNLAQEAQTKELYGTVVNLKSTLQQKVQEFQLLEKQQNDLIAPPNVEEVKRLLTKAKKQALDESEDLAAQWTDEGGDVDAFTSEFLAKRKVHHVRAAKLERLKATSRP